jgi:hypothetical protein
MARPSAPAIDTGTPDTTCDEAQRPWADRRARALARAQEALDRDAAQRGRDADTALSPSSVFTYRTKGRRLLRTLMTQRPVDLRAALVKVLSRHAPSANAYRCAVASLQWALRRNLQRHSRALADPNREPAHWPRLCALIELAADLLQILDTTQRRDVLAASGQTSRQRQSKFRDLQFLPTGWRDRMVAESSASPTFGPAVALLAVCAPRPAELEAGVYLYADGPDVVVIIPGAKVTNESGQPWRELRIRRSAFPPTVLSMLDVHGIAWIEVNRTSLRNYLLTLSKRLWPDLRAGKRADARPITISAYTFRHALAEELRETSWEDHDIAAALGHCAGETQRQYGRRRRRGSLAPRTTPIKAVSAARPVRFRAAGRLEALLARKRASPAAQPRLRP